MAKKRPSEKTRARPKRGRAVRRSSGPTRYSIPCHSLHQGQHEMHLFAMSAKSLWNVVQINQRKEDKEEGYQRALSISRVSKIAKYLDDGNAIPGAILISFDKAKLSAGGTEFIIENVEDAGWVIDGQHRLAGAYKANRDVEVPVVAFLNLSSEQQIELFVTINREQKGVPTSLYYDLLKQLPRKLSDAELIQERANDLVGRLRRDAESPFYRRIRVTTSPRPGELSSTNVIRKLTPHLRRDGRLAIFSDEERVAILNNLYRALEQVFPKEYKRADTLFFSHNRVRSDHGCTTGDPRHDLAPCWATDVSRRFSR